ncbi:conjugal transfer protein TraD [Bacillus thuringiensis]|uniref:conjugal transfer protein TraD n=1 Tax=Bacillus thuringiensis TaxID=1428 RepID=UPI001930EFF9|nr:conjugal transfer protein TraD [Bacillus thuringiensis]MDZ3956240.1 conjugal transfer protein TraD [Bacillus thuringiensis]
MDDKNLQENIHKTNERLRILQQKKKIALHEKQKLDRKLDPERKERTRRLIQKGALLEKYLNVEEKSIDDTERLLKVLAEFANKNKQYIENKLKDL